MPVTPPEPVRRPTAPATWFPGVPGAVPGGAPGRLRLVCFPHAGGTPSVFHTWPAHLGDTVRVVPVLLPGRGLRLHEPPYDALAPLAGDIAQALAAREPAVRSVFFGHSMGALLAYEVACVLRDRGLPEPDHLYVSGSRAPHLYGDRADHTLDDEELLRVLRDLGGLGLHDEDSAHVRRRLPALRADLRCCELYRWTARPPLRCPVTAVSGTDDPIATPVQVDAWHRYSTGHFTRLRLRGDHFFFVDGASRDPLLRDLRATCERVGSPLLPRRNAS